MEFLISVSQALNSIYLRLKTDWKTNSIVDNQMLYQEFPKLYKISQGIVLKENWSCRYSLANLKDLNCHSRLKTCISSNKKITRYGKHVLHDPQLVGLPSSAIYSISGFADNAQAAVDLSSADIICNPCRCILGS